MKSPTTAYASEDAASSLVKPNNSAASPRSSIAPTETDDELPHVPLAVQASFRRKLMACIALQLVGLSRGIAFLEGTCSDWLQSAIVDNARVYIALVTTLVLLLAGLHFVRDRFPFNGVMLTFLTIVLAFFRTTVDIVLGFPLIVINCVFLCVVEIVMVAMAGWSCSSLPFESIPSASRPPFLTALVGYVVASPTLQMRSSIHVNRLTPPYVVASLLVIVGCCMVNVCLTLGVVFVSIYVQLVLGSRLVFQVQSLSLPLMPSNAYAWRRLPLCRHFVWAQWHRHSPAVVQRGLHRLWHHDEDARPHIKSVGSRC